MAKYQDPVNADVYFVTRCESGEELIQYLQKFYPDMITGISNNYTMHLKLFEKNWQHVCSEVFKTKTQQIILVKFIPKDHKDPVYKILNNIYSKLSKLGYVIRSDEELELCKKCNNTILTLKSCQKMSVKYTENCDFYSNYLSNQR